MDYNSTASQVIALPDRKQREREARGDLILEAAQQVFEEKGYQAATMADIAERAGFGKSSIYFYFKSKDEIYVTLIVEGLKELRAKVLARIASTDTVQEKINVILTAFMDFLRGRRSYYDALVLFYPEDSPATLPAELEEAWGREILTSIELLASIVDALQPPARRDIREARQRVFIVVGACLGIYSLTQSRSKALRNRLDYDRLMEIVRNEVVPALFRLDGWATGARSTPPSALSSPPRRRHSPVRTKSGSQSRRRNHGPS
ncbi:MAG: TetR/AcrR family transcriptional regulator [Nitrospirae bacterium]|nr:TetR/AcrR family transcriptional regulator [Nitrospirota bacterium]